MCRGVFADRRASSHNRQSRRTARGQVRPEGDVKSCLALHRREGAFVGSGKRDSPEARLCLESGDRRAGARLCRHAVLWRRRFARRGRTLRLLRRDALPPRLGSFRRDLGRDPLPPRRTSRCAVHRRAVDSPQVARAHVPCLGQRLQQPSLHRGNPGRQACSTCRRRCHDFRRHSEEEESRRRSPLAARRAHGDKRPAPLDDVGFAHRSWNGTRHAHPRVRQ